MILMWIVGQQYALVFFPVRRTSSTVPQSNRLTYSLQSTGAIDSKHCE